MAPNNCALPYLMSIFPEACYFENLKEQIPLHIARLKNDNKIPLKYLLYPEETISNYEKNKFNVIEQKHLEFGGNVVKKIWGNTIETKVIQQQVLLGDNIVKEKYFSRNIRKYYNLV